MSVKVFTRRGGSYKFYEDEFNGELILFRHHRSYFAVAKHATLQKWKRINLYVCKYDPFTHSRISDEFQITSSSRIKEILDEKGKPVWNLTIC